jgi:ABC transport system ATP-binding/permease protein
LARDGLAQGLAVGYARPRFLAEHQSDVWRVLAVAAGDRICRVGRNGSGKSTLLRIAARLVQADAGECFVQPGATVQYLSQEPGLVGFDTTLAYVEASFDGSATDGRHRALYLLKELGLSGEEDPASLSGGEARRVALARALASSPDILLLDEPTNHLDLPSRQALEAILAQYDGTLLFVSHDRYFVDALATTLWTLDNGVITSHVGGYSAYRTKKAQAEARAAQQTKAGQTQSARNTQRQGVGAAADAPSRSLEDVEREIAQLEQRLKEIEGALEEASVATDLERITALGAEYEETRAALDTLYETWQDMAS